jgi:hypothetical protein
MKGWTKIVIELYTPDSPDASSEEEWQQMTFRSWWYYYAFGAILHCWGRHLRQVMKYRFGACVCVVRWSDIAFLSRNMIIVHYAVTLSC